MRALSAAGARGRSAAGPAILGAGLVAGALDLIAAFVNSRGGPVRTLQAIASGLLGADSYRGGWATALLGAGLHFLIAIAAAAVYYAASRRLKILTSRPVLCGLLYGIAVYLVMNLIVLPLSAFPHRLSYPLVALATGLLIHMFLVGLPIALLVSRYSK